MSTCGWKIIFEHLNIWSEKVLVDILLPTIVGKDKQTAFQQLFDVINQLLNSIFILLEST